MKIARTVNLGGYQSQKFESSEHDKMNDCVKDLLDQMAPLAAMYPTVGGVMSELKRAYNIS